MTSEDAVSLSEIREQIDNIDKQIIVLLLKRAGLVSAAGKLKKDKKGVRDPKRIEQVIEKVKARAAEAGLAPDIAEQIYRTMITCFIDQELKVLRGE